MSYNTPEVVVLGNADAVIQMQIKPITIGWDGARIDGYAFVPAYDLDE
jgi:hypothetical protein